MWSGGGSSENFAIKVVDGQRIGLGERFAVYRQMCVEGNAPAVTEPQVVQAAALPASGAVYGGGAACWALGRWGCLYAGRLANLAVYTLLCWAALRNCKRYAGGVLRDGHPCR